MKKIYAVITLVLLLVGATMLVGKTPEVAASPSPSGTTPAMARSSSKEVFCWRKSRITRFSVRERREAADS